MTDAGQILIIAAISIMTIVSTIIGIQIIFILRDFRKTLVRLNAVVNACEKFGANVTAGSSELMGFVSGLRNVMTVIDVITEKKKHGTK